MKINLSSKTAREKITESLDGLQKRCTARTIDFDDILSAVETIEKKLGVPKCRLDGTLAHVDLRADDFPSAYKYTPTSTQFEVVNNKGKWYLTDIMREDCRRFNQKFVIYMSETTKKAILEKFQSFPF